VGHLLALPTALRHAPSTQALHDQFAGPRRAPRAAHPMQYKWANRLLSVVIGPGANGWAPWASAPSQERILRCVQVHLYWLFFTWAWGESRPALKCAPNPATLLPVPHVNGDVANPSLFPSQSSSTKSLASCIRASSTLPMPSSAMGTLQPCSRAQWSLLSFGPGSCPNSCVCWHSHHFSKQTRSRFLL
jgi:hypothetical protein